MSLGADFVLEALLQQNFFPMQSEEKEELPPVLTSSSFTPDIARKLVAGAGSRSSDGYDAVEYRLTRFNGVFRHCSIPHPTAYADLALFIHEHWDKLNYITENENSVIRPKQHPDGRVIIMDYSKSPRDTKRTLEMLFSKRFKVRADISNFYPSIYSHAIPWALIGVNSAKNQRTKKTWFNSLDQKVRSTKRNETNGVVIGPASSNIIAELILARIDKEMSGRFNYLRFIDDYKAYCSTESDAQDFILELSKHLAIYNLHLNISKTEVLPLPRTLENDWVAELSLQLATDHKLSSKQASRYLDLSVQLAKQSPDGSVLKYALKSLVGQYPELLGDENVFRYALQLAFHQPALVPLLGKFFDVVNSNGTPFLYTKEVKKLTIENVRMRRSDAASWMLYYQIVLGIDIDPPCAGEVVESRDCIPLLLLYLSGNRDHQKLVIEFAKNLDASDIYELDQYWLLLYQLFLDEKIDSPYKCDRTFRILADSGVSFVCSRSGVRGAR